MYKGRNKPSKLKIPKKSESSIIKDIRNLLKLKKKKNKAIKDWKIRIIRTLFEKKETYLLQASKSS